MDRVVSIRFQTNLATGNSKYANFRREAPFYTCNLNCDWFLFTSNAICCYKNNFVAPFSVQKDGWMKICISFPQTNWTSKLINMTRAWDKEKIWVPDRNRPCDLPNTWQALYPLSYKNSWRARSFDCVHMWQVSYILLGSALFNKWIKKVNFKLGIEMWMVNWSTWHECGTKI